MVEVEEVQLQKALLGVIAYGRVLKRYGFEEWLGKLSRDSLLRYGLRFVEAWERYTGRQVEFDNDVQVEQEFEKVLEILMFIRYNYKFQSVYKVIDKFYESRVLYDQGSVSAAELDKDVEEFVTQFRNYVGGRWGQRYESVLNSANVQDIKRAAVVVKKVAKEFGLTVEKVIKAQHECYPNIQSPFTVSALKNEGKVRERTLRWLVKRKGEVIAVQSADVAGNVAKDVTGKKVTNEAVNDPTTSYVKRRWVEVVKTIGVVRFMQIARGGFFVDLCKRIVQEVREQGGDVGDRSYMKKVLEKYSPEFVAELWVKEGKPVIAF